MAAKTIDAELLAKMFLAGAKNLESQKEHINELNVFPVPDGDTGTNMTLTIMSAAKDVYALENPGKRVLLLATPLTLRQERVLAMKEKYDSLATITVKGARGLVELIEAGHTGDAELLSFLRGLFSDELSEGNLPDAVVLGCTHYPHVKGAIRAVLGEGVRLYDGGEGTARRCRSLLSEANLLNPQQTRGRVEFFGSDPEKIPLCRKFFQEIEE